MTDETDGGAGAAVESTLRGLDIDHIFVEFADINGLSGSKQLQADYFLDSWRDGLAMNALLFVQTPRNDVPEDSGLGEAIDYGDAMVHPQPETFRRLPWRPDSARVLCSFEMDGEPVGAAPGTLSSGCSTGRRTRSTSSSPSGVNWSSICSHRQTATETDTSRRPTGAVPAGRRTVMRPLRVLRGH